MVCASNPLVDAYFKTIREEAGPALWSKGVELARQDAVTGDSEQGGEIRLRVLNKSGGVSPTVTLNIGEGDWHCTCGGDDDPCAHVAAAVIALKRAREAGKELPRSAQGSGKLVYRLTSSPQGLQFERYIKDEAAETLLTAALTALTSGRVKGPAVSATAEDMQVEVALASDRRGLLPAGRWPAVLKALATGLPTTLDAQSVRINPQPVGLAALVSDDGPGVRVKIQQDEAISQLFANGVARCGEALRPVVLPQLNPAQRELVRDGRFFPRSEFAHVVGDLIPGLQQLMPVTLRARNLPAAETAAWACLQLDLQVSADAELSVEAQLHYGQPSLARLKHGQLLATGDRVPRRDPDEESRLREELRKRLQLEVDQPVRLNSVEAVRFVQRLATYPLTTTGRGLAFFTLYPELAPELTASASAATIGFRTASPGGEAKGADPTRVLEAWRRGDPLVPLLDGGMAPLPTAWLAAHGERLLAFLAARGDGAKPLPVAALPLLAEVSESFGQSLPPGLAELCRKLQQAASDQPDRSKGGNIVRPKLQGTLRSYQEEGVQWLRTLQELGVGALLADDMGLGKTLQALAVVKGRTLVVAPTSVLFNWLAEARKFRPDLRPILYHGPSRRLDAEADVVLTSYAVLRLDQDVLAAQSWDMLVLDEAQMLKNPDSLTTLAAARIDARFRLGLSGTPVENRLDDLWSLIHLLNPGLLGDRRFFQEHYAKPIMAGDELRASALRRRLKPCLLRRLKRDVAADLPPRTETVLYAELSTEERARYDMVLAATRQEVLNQLAVGGSVLAALEALLRLRQAACHPDLLPGVHGENSAKLALLVQALQTSGDNGHKTLVFSQWTSFLDLMEPALASAGLSYLRLDGSTSDRGAVVRAFQQPGGAQVLIMSLKAGGVGLNLTAADHVIIADPWWNPAAEDQAADRAHRIGQERPVLIQRLVALGTVEERILALQEAKRGLAKAAVDGAGAGFSALSRDDLVALLS